MPEDLILTPQQIIRRKAAGEPIDPNEPEVIRQHMITVLVENTIGSFIRVVNMFSARGFNIKSIAVGETEERSVSRMNIVTSGNSRVISQVLRQLSRLVDTIAVDDLRGTDFVEREILLLKIRYTPESRAQIMDTNTIFRGKVVDITHEAFTFELTGPAKKIDAFINMMRPYDILEVARSGQVAMKRDHSFSLFASPPSETQL